MDHDGIMVLYCIIISIFPLFPAYLTQIITQIGGTYEASKTYLGATDARDAWE